ncbi:DUF2236 domain-containing protein, partial [Mumia zhuanghuii]
MTTNAYVSGTPLSPAFPTRYREAEARSARIARPLKLVGGVREVDEDLMAR